MSQTMQVLTQLVLCAGKQTTSTKGGKTGSQYQARKKTETSTKRGKIDNQGHARQNRKPVLSAGEQEESY